MPSLESTRTPPPSPTATLLTRSTSPPPGGPDPEPGRHIEWARTFFAALEPHSRAVYVNNVNDDAANRVRETAYGANKWSRLVALKGKYDPTNFFRCNANIPPHGGGV